MTNRSFTWINENQEHSDSDYARAKALAKKWSELETQRENKYYDSLARNEDGCDYDPFEDCECEYCLVANHTECESRKQWQTDRDAKQAEFELEIELVEDKLEAIGARMMRPYEHWNEDERYMEYMENRYDY